MQLPHFCLGNWECVSFIQCYRSKHRTFFSHFRIWWGLMRPKTSVDPMEDEGSLPSQMGETPRPQVHLHQVHAHHVTWSDARLGSPTDSEIESQMTSLVGRESLEAADNCRPGWGNLGPWFKWRLGLSHCLEKVNSPACRLLVAHLHLSTVLSNTSGSYV